VGEWVHEVRVYGWRLMGGYDMICEGESVRSSFYLFFFIFFGLS